LIIDNFRRLGLSAFDLSSIRLISLPFFD